MRPASSLCLLLPLILVLCTQISTSSKAVPQQENPKQVSIAPDRTTCIGCVLLVSIIEQLAQVHNTTTQKSMELLCSYLPEQYSIKGICLMVVELFGPDLIKLFNNQWNADVICHAIKLCGNDPRYPICHLYQVPKVGFKKSVKEAKKVVKRSNYLVGFKKSVKEAKKVVKRSNYLQSSEAVSGVLIKICSLPVVSRICEMIETSTPFEDFDQDKFSAIPFLRGYDWRGRDCNDVDKSVYPGRRPQDWDALHDSNCNGISGFDPEDGTPYEKKFCEGTDTKGIVLLGDSAGAHFHIPPEWLTPKDMSSKAFSSLPRSLSNEFDWPQFSLYTGYENSSIGGWTSSLYLRLRNRNRCNHRDYQSISRNGASSSNLLEFLKSLARNQQFDNPAVVFYAMIGNDVCNTHTDTLSSMTTPKQMFSNVMTALEHLDTYLPNGSHVVLVGLADGRFLWDTLHNTYHPIGQLNKDVTYAQMYSFLSCLKSNPCEGWMNSNETLRNLTTERAEQLSSVLEEIASSQKFKNFDVFYFEHLYRKVIAEWSRLGGEQWKLIEPVDGFHPSQIACAIGADIIWKEAIQIWPELFGKENPHNEEIIAMFGDQGGH